MDKMVEETILSYLPTAKKIEDGDKGTCKILLPCPVKQMEECEALRRALKDSPAKPTCFRCHSHNTRFRYFDNSSSKSLQARYKCLACNQLFTFGGKQYTKQQNALTIQPNGQTNLASSDLISDAHAMGGKEILRPINFFEQEAAIYQNQDWGGQLRQHTPTEDDCLFDLQLCLNPGQGFIYKCRDCLRG